MEKRTYGVLVGETWVNEGLMTESAAEELALMYQSAGYADVFVVDTDTAEDIN